MFDIPKKDSHLVKCIYEKDVCSTPGIDKNSFDGAMADVKHDY